MPDTSPLGVSTAKAAEYLGVSHGTIRRWADTGALKCHRTPGGQRRFTRTQLDAVVALWGPPTEEETHAAGTASSAAHPTRPGNADASAGPLNGHTGHADVSSTSADDGDS